MRPAAEPAKPVITRPSPRTRTLRASAFITVSPRLTWPSPAMATTPSLRTVRIVVGAELWFGHSGIFTSLAADGQRPTSHSNSFGLQSHFLAIAARPHLTQAYRGSPTIAWSWSKCSFKSRFDQSQIALLIGFAVASLGLDTRGTRASVAGGRRNFYSNITVPRFASTIPNARRSSPRTTRPQP